MNSPLLHVLCFAVQLWCIESKKKKARQPLSSNHQQETLQYLFIGIGIAALLGVLIYLLYRRSQLMRAEKLRSIKRALEVKEQYKKSKPCTMTQMQKDQAIAWFAKNNWILEQSQGKSTPQKIPLKIISVQRKKQPVDGSLLLKDYYDAFYVQIKGSSSMIFGVIMFESYYPTILFEKSVSSSKNQLGNYNYTFFEGLLKKGKFQGRWYSTNDTKIEQEREAWQEKEKNGKEESVSERSFSNLDRSLDDIRGSNRSKNHTGSFKLYYE